MDTRMVWRDCGECGDEGYVPEVVDPEIPYAGWDCPTCLTTHETTDDVFDVAPI